MYMTQLVLCKLMQLSVNGNDKLPIYMRRHWFLHFSFLVMIGSFLLWFSKKIFLDTRIATVTTWQVQQSQTGTNYPSISIYFNPTQGTRKCALNDRNTAKTKIPWYGNRS